MSAQRTTDQQIADAEARLDRLRQKRRQEETRKKILIGAMVLQQIGEDETAYRNLLQGLDEYLTQDRDRRLFDLPAHQTPGTPLNPSQQIED
nr:hypothetical protein [uncultured Halomonas sp.]